MKLVNVQVIKDELERLIRNYWFLSSAEAKYRCVVYMELSEWLDGLDVKEVDLDKERRKYLTEYFNVYEDGILQSKRSNMPLDTFDVIHIAKHFFELGTKAQSKDMIEALRTEYEKGRADVIADTLSWLENCWPQYCSNQTIIEGFKEAIKGE